MSENVLRLDHVTMQFGGVVAVNDLSMEVNDKEIVALIGPNGAGKTTAFNCITGVYEPTNGMVSFMGKTMVCNHPQGKMKKLYTGDLYPEFSHVVSPTPDQITKLGIARTFQNIRLFRSLTVFDNVLIAKHMRAKQNVFTATLRLDAKEEKRMRDEAMALLKEQHLEHLKDDIAGSLPYGLQRRLEIARALATDPKLLLLDEPAADKGAPRVHQPDKARIQHTHTDDRASHGSCYGHSRAHIRAGFRPADRLRHRRRGTGQSRRHKRLPGGG